MTSKRIPIGFDQLYYAVMTDADNETYGTPVRLNGARSLSISPKVDDSDLYADDILYANVKSLNNYDIELETAELETADRAAILGHTLDANGGLIERTTDSAPYIALLYRRKLVNGKYRYSVLHKVKFAPAKDDIKTKEDKTSYQTPTITGTAIPRTTDAIARFSVTDGDPGVTSGFLTNFFNSVYVPSADAVAPTVTVVPAAAATNVAVSSNVVFTFSEPIQQGSVNGSNFLLFKTSDGSAVASSVSVNAGGTVVTLHPLANLSAATAYTAVATTNVKDLAGNPLAAAKVIPFTTA